MKEKAINIVKFRNKFLFLILLSTLIYLAVSDIRFMIFFILGYLINWVIPEQED